MGNDIRRCGKCHHFQPHEITMTDTERKMKCTICDEEMVETINDGYGLPYQEEEEGKDDKE